MIAFGSGMSAAGTAAVAAHEAALEALQAYRARDAGTPELAIVFASSAYDDVELAAQAVRTVVGDAQIVGGTSGASVFDGERVAPRGVSVVLLGGDGIAVESRVAQLGSSSFMETVPVAERIARAAQEAAGRGFSHFACLALAPRSGIDGEALVAAIRKGAGAHAQLAGGLTGNDLTADHPRVFFGDELRDDCVVLTGLFTKTPVGISARHGWKAVGPIHIVTRADGVHLLELDERPALEVWLEDARRAGAEPPTDRAQLATYLENHYEIGIADASASRIAVASDAQELVVRAPFAILEDGALRMSASIAEGTLVRVVHATREDLLRASRAAAEAAASRAGRPLVGALVLGCGARLAALGDAFPEEPAGIRHALDAPLAGTCVVGEIARNVRDSDAFFNTTVVVIAFS